MAGIEDSLIAIAGAGVGAMDASLRARLDALVVSADGGGDPACDCLGTRNLRLLGLYARLSGARLEACAACAACGERNEFDVPVDDLLASPAADPETRIALAGAVFRLPRMADLDARRTGPRAEPIAWQVARLCRVEGDGAIDAALIEALGEAFEAADPVGSVTLALDCAQCGHHFPVSLDIALLVGDACVRLADALLRDVDSIASAYGWSEPQILSLPPERRSRYVAMIAARRTPGSARPRAVDRPA